MNKVLLIIYLYLISSEAFANNEECLSRWNKDFEKVLLQRAEEKLSDLSTYPFFNYPNEDHQKIFNHFSKDKILLFAYGSLMNKISAARSIKAEAVDSMKPAVAFGLIRLFNYKAFDTSNWGKNLDSKEKAMLNVMQTQGLEHMINGVTLIVDSQDLKKLILREKGYDLIPILVTSWEDILKQNHEIKISIAYTFIASGESRNDISYTSTEYYPVLGYLKAVQEASQTYGCEFAAFWNATTFLADGITPIEKWCLPIKDTTTEPTENTERDIFFKKANQLKGI